VASDITRDERRFLDTAIHRISGGRRFIDKNPEKRAAHPYLDALFPDATSSSSPGTPAPTCRR